MNLARESPFRQEWSATAPTDPFQSPAPRIAFQLFTVQAVTTLRARPPEVYDTIRNATRKNANGKCEPRSMLDLRNFWF